MSRVLMLNMPAEGHINPTLGLVEELIRRGEEVVYVCTERYRAKIESTGAAFIGYTDFMENMDVEEQLKQPPNPMYMMTKMVELALLLTPEILEKIEGQTFDYVMYDTMFTVGAAVAKQLKLPGIAMCTTFALGEDAMEMFKKAGLVMSAPDSPEVQAFEQRAAQLQEEYGITVRGPLDMFRAPAEMTLVFTSRYLQPNEEKFDDSFVFVGPSVAPRSDVEPFPTEELAGHKVVYISMGTILNKQPEIYKTCFDALGDLDVKVVLSAGKTIDLESLGGIPANFIVRRYVPQLEVLQVADVFLTHAGMNSTSEGLYYGVPLAMLPLMNDQPMVAERVRSLGAAVVLDKNALTPEAVREAVQTLLTDPSYKEASEKIGATLREGGGYVRAADEVLRFMQSPVKS